VARNRVLRKQTANPDTALIVADRSGINKALWAVIMTAYITGTSTRKVDDLVKAPAAAA
jgi:transposase-like protein